MDAIMRTARGPAVDLGAGNLFSRPTLSLAEAGRLRERAMILRRKARALAAVGMTKREKSVSWHYGQRLLEKADDLTAEAADIDDLTANTLDDGEIDLVCPGCGARVNLLLARRLGDGTRVCGLCKTIAEIRSTL